MAKSKKPKLLLRIDHGLYFIALGLLAVFVGVVVILTHADRQDQVGKSGSTATAEQSLYKSLDIRDLRKVSYTSSQVTKVQDLGVSANAHQYIFKFAVPHDNLTEKGLMTLPVTAEPAGGYPVVILCHGYSNPWSYSTTKAYLSDMEFYSQHGFAVLKPDFRGQGLSIPDGQPEGAFYSSAYNTDVLSLVAAVKNTVYLNKADINMWGHSMGAYIALRAAVISPDIKNVILLSGPVGYPADMFRSYIAISDTSNPTAANIRLDQLDKHGTPLSNPGFWDNTAPINFVAGTKAHIQIHVGTADRTVPPHFSADLDQALTKAGEVHQYFIYQGGNHGLGQQRTQIYQRSLQLLQGS